MYASHTNRLTEAIDAITKWRATAVKAGLNLNQVNIAFPDGQTVVFSWDAEAADGLGGKGDWKIDV